MESSIRNTLACLLLPFSFIHTSTSLALSNSRILNAHSVEKKYLALSFSELINRLIPSVPFVVVSYPSGYIALPHSPALLSFTWASVVSRNLLAACCRRRGELCEGRRIQLGSRVLATSCNPTIDSLAYVLAYGPFSTPLKTSNIKNSPVHSRRALTVVIDLRAY